MLYYSTTQQGIYHIEKNIVCQDSHCVRKVNDKCYVVAVADGLGSELHSDIASQIAAEESTKYCQDKLANLSEDIDVTSIIKESFLHALTKVQERVLADGGDDFQYDTTLCLGILHDNKLFWGQSGDSGIIALLEDGHYEAITEQQRDENGCVFPLCFGETKWQFGQKEGVISVLFATDGMLEIFFPALLRGEENRLYIALAQFFMDLNALKQDGNMDFQKKMSEFVGRIPGNQVDDDKTVVVLINDEVSPQYLDDSYYAVPDWESLQKKRQEEFRRLAYPHMYDSNEKESGSLQQETPPNNADTDIVEDKENSEECEGNSFVKETVQSDSMWNRIKDIFK